MTRATRDDVEDLLFTLRWAADAFPQQRVGQIIANALRQIGRTNCDPFYVENDALTAALRDYMRAHGR